MKLEKFWGMAKRYWWMVNMIGIDEGIIEEVRHVDANNGIGFRSDGRKTEEVIGLANYPIFSCIKRTRYIAFRPTDVPLNISPTYYELISDNKELATCTDISKCTLSIIIYWHPRDSTYPELERPFDNRTDFKPVEGLVGTLGDFIQNLPPETVLDAVVVRTETLTVTSSKPGMLFKTLLSTIEDGNNMNLGRITKRVHEVSYDIWLLTLEED